MPSTTQAAANKGVVHSFCITLHYPLTLIWRACDSSEELVTCIACIPPQPRNDKGSIHALILEQPAQKPYDLQTRVCWSNKEAKFASVKQAKSKVGCTNVQWGTYYTE